MRQMLRSKLASRALARIVVWMQVSSWDHSTNNKLLGELVDCVDKKLPKIGHTQWFEYVVVPHAYLRIWTMRFAVCMSVDLQLGLFVEGAATLALKLTARSQDQDIEKSSTQNMGGGAQSEAIGQELRVRDSTSDRPQPLEKQFDHDRDCATYASLAIRNVQNCSHCTGDNDVVRSESFRLGTASHQRGRPSCFLEDALSTWLRDEVAHTLSLHLEHPAAAKDNGWVEVVGGCVLTVGQRRWSSCAWFSGLPGCFVGLASAPCRDGILPRSEHMHSDWHAIQDFHERFWNILRKRSGMKNMHLEQMFALLRRSDWQVTANHHGRSTVVGKTGHQSVGGWHQRRARGGEAKFQHGHVW